MTWQPIIETCGPIIAAAVLVAAIFAVAMRANNRFPAARRVAPAGDDA